MEFMIDFVLILPALTALFLIHPAIVFAGICAGMFLRRPIAIPMSAVAGCITLMVLVYTQLFHLEMGRFPSVSGIVMYFCSAALGSAIWAFVTCEFRDWKAARRELALQPNGKGVLK